jgi:RHS repeat-associated protein
MPVGTAPIGPGYAGHDTDPSGLVYMQARFYDPQLGRFLSTDPVDPDSMTGGNFNRYAYVEDNPYSKYDPSGRYSCVGASADCDAIADAVDSIVTAATNPALTVEQQASLLAVQALYGGPDDDNGVTIHAEDGNIPPAAAGGTWTASGVTTVGLALHTVGDTPDDRSSPGFQDRLTGLLAHEGQHGIDQRTAGMPTSRASEKALELKGATTEAALFEGLESDYGPWLWTSQHGAQPNGIQREAEHSTAIWCNRNAGVCK